MGLHNCCPECGSKKMSTVTGLWEREYNIKGWFIWGSKRINKREIHRSILSYYEITKNNVLKKHFTLFKICKMFF